MHEWKNGWLGRYYMKTLHILDTVAITSLTSISSKHVLILYFSFLHWKFPVSFIDISVASLPASVYRAKVNTFCCTILVSYIKSMYVILCQQYVWRNNSPTSNSFLSTCAVYTYRVVLKYLTHKSNKTRSRMKKSRRSKEQTKHNQVSKRWNQFH